MARRISQLIEEHENRSKLFRTRNLDVKVERIEEDSQKSGVPTPNREEVSPSNPMKESQQRKVTMSKEDKNQNGKSNTEMKFTGKKDRKINKKRENIEKSQKVPEGTSQKEGLQDCNFIGISEQSNMAKQYSC